MRQFGAGSPIAIKPESAAGTLALRVCPTKGNSYLLWAGPILQFSCLYQLYVFLSTTYFLDYGPRRLKFKMASRYSADTTKTKWKLKMKK